MAKKKTSVVGFLITLAALILFSFLPQDLQDLIKSLVGVQTEQSGGGMSAATSGLPDTAGTYETAKKYLYEDIHGDHRVTLYCGCEYDRDKDVDLKSCGMSALSSVSRATRVEAEHVMPASYFGDGLDCWEQELCTDSDGEKFKGRECCKEFDAAFNAAHNDLHNLFPSVGEVNGDRSSSVYGEVPGEARRYGDCDFEVGGGVAEPAPGVRGDVARAWLYMADTYGVDISQHRSMLEGWHREDPPDDWERERSRRVKKIQGRGNPWIE